MTVYVALLRGINVGGNNIVSMASLKDRFERLGFKDVSTYINSGNVFFRSPEADARRIETRIDRMLGREYGLSGKTVVRSQAEMAELMRTIAKTWKPDPEWRRNVIFLRHTIDSEDVLAGISPKHDIERVVYCPGTLLWAARREALTRSAMLKLSSKPTYREMTVRNVNTTRAIAERMQQMAEEDE
jgi:uncharacterized protein (DUF1697 family)